jgi:hypothetical protein
LDFANVKALDPRITFTRASSARYYDGKTVALAEQNLLLQSQAFTTSPWVTTGISAVSLKTAPDGTSTAIEITATTTNGRTGQPVTVISGATYIFSMFVRRVTGTGNVNLIIADGSGTALFTTTMSLSGSWQRFEVSGAPALNSINARVVLTTSGDAVEVWGAQVEQRSAVTAYTPTTTAPITNYVPVLLSAANNVARFDHNPVTGESLGLLIEEQRTNLVLRSEEFDNASWSKTNSSITANTIIAPDGTLTGDKHIPNSGATIGVGASSTRVYQNPSLVSGTAYVLTLYAKAAEYDQLQLAVITTPSSSAAFSLTAGTVVSGTGATITAVGNGWYRCSLPFTADITGGQQIRLSAFSSTVSTGDGFSGIFIWGAQVEAGAFPTSYIPTVASQVTRSADAASMTGANFSSWFGNPNENTFYAEASKPQTNNANATLLEGADVKGLTISTDGAGNKPRALVRQGSSRYDSIATAAVFSANAVLKIAVGTSSGGSAAVFNGSVVSSVTPPAQSDWGDALRIGSRTLSGSPINFWNGHIRKLAYYPKRITNDQLQGMTTV